MSEEVRPRPTEWEERIKTFIKKACTEAFGVYKTTKTRPRDYEEFRGK